MDERDEELHWLKATETAVEMVAAGQFVAALMNWKAACAAADGFVPDDPRRAANLNNVAVGLRLCGEPAQAGDTYQQAMEAWLAASAWVEGMRLAPRARSSLFHLRLERHHRAIYDGHLRAKYARILAGGRAVSEYNVAELGHAGARDARAAEAYRRTAAARRGMDEKDDRVAEVMESSLAAAESGVSTWTGLRAVTAVCSFRVLAERRGWIIDRPAVFTDEGRLMAAVLCTAAVHHAAAARLVRE